MIKIICVCLLVLLSGCGSYDWKLSDDALVGGESPPTITVTSDLTVDDSSDVATFQPLPVSFGHATKSPASLDITWTQDPGNPASALIVAGGSAESFFPNGGQLHYEALFPRNGLYQLYVTASDGKHTTQATVIVSVSASTQFALSGTVLDNLSPRSGLTAELRFRDGGRIEAVSTAVDGSFLFDDLIGDRAQYEIVVQ